MQRQVSKLPLLGDLPLVGKLFQNSDLQSQRNELVIVVTPHVIKPGDPIPPPSATLALPTPGALPTLPPDTRLPGEYPRAAPSPTTVPLPSGGGLPIQSASASPIPIPTPTAFATTNVFTYGAAPANTFANDTDVPQIFYAQFQPTLLRAGTPVQVSVVTTSNVHKVEVGYAGYMTTLTQVAPSKWQGAFNFNGAGLSSNVGASFQLTLNAFNALGSAASIRIPVSVYP